VANDLVRRAAEVFFQICALPADEQDGVLARIMDEDPALGAKVREILRGDRGFDPRLDRPAVARLTSRELDLLLPTGTVGIDLGPRLQPGQRLADFQIEELLARGGMGEVYRARQLSLDGRPVALKVMSSPDRARASIERFRREALLLADLHHQSLADVYGFGEAEGILFIAMRLVPGPTLRQIQREWRVRAVPFEERRERVLLWMAQVVEALAVVHAKGLVHRDVKPSNVILEGYDPPRTDGRAVLVDFGLVRRVALGTHTETGPPPATRGFASPEQALGQPLDPRSDVFSVGVTMHDLLAARQVEEREPASAGLPPLGRMLPECGRDLSAVVAKATALDARWRYADASTLLDDLRALREGSETTARRRMPLERAQRWISSRSVRLLQGTLVAVGLVCGAALVSYWRRGEVHAEAARRARAEADLETLLEEARRVPALLRRLGASDELEEYAAIPVSAGSSDALGRIVWFLRGNDYKRAMREVVTELRLHGLPERPLLARYLENMLQERDPSGALSHRARIALRFAARLFYERPNESPEDSAASAAVRDALLMVLDREEDPNWRHALTALSGCGKTADVLRILDRIVACDPQSEDERLGLKTVERLLSRALAGGTASDVPLSATTEALARIGPPLFVGVRSEWFWGKARELDETASLLRVGALSFLETSTALAFAQRSSGPTAQSRVLVELCSAFHDRGELSAELLLMIQAAFGDPRALPSLRSGEGVLKVYTDAWGRLCGFTGQAELYDQARDALASEPPEARERFERGLLAGIAEREGRRSLTFDLDEDTLLGAQLPGWERVESVRNDEPPPPGLLAGWQFEAKRCRRSGGAHSAMMLGGRLQPDESGDGHVRLAPGESELRLLFELPERPVTTVGLLVDHEAAARGYYPLQGEVSLEIEIDGRLVQSLWLPGAQRRRPFGPATPPTVRLLALVFDPGKHELVLRMGPLSTTTYRVHQVELRSAWPGPEDEEQRAEHDRRR
jgi:hypothetical protein